MKLTISKPYASTAALQSLDQYTKVFKNADGVETPVSVPFNWTPDTRWAIFGNIRILAPIDEDFKKLSDAEVKQRSGGKPSLKQSDDPALFQELVDNVNKIAGKGSRGPACRASRGRVQEPAGAFLRSGRARSDPEGCRRPLYGSQVA